LDEQSKTGRGTDEDWLLQIETNPKTKGCEHLQLPKIKNSTFIVKHFASDVCYKIDGFLVKNLDSVSEKLLGTIANSTVSTAPFMQPITLLLVWLPARTVEPCSGFSIDGKQAKEDGGRIINVYGT
jgi:myosin heavy subunit